MSFKLAAAAATLASLASTVSAHGYVQTLDVGDTLYWNYNTTLQYMTPVPDSIGWSDPEDEDNGYVSDYTSPDIICHVDATNAQLYADVTAGDNVTFHWTTWPDSHKGPVLTYLAKCDDDCTTVDKTTLKFFKIDEGGLIDGYAASGGTWASDELIGDDNSWSSQIPSSIAPGNYVVRHEIIALHNAETAGGAQNYPQCMNLKITSDGTDEPEGTLGESLYTSTDPGLVINIWNGLSTYDIPGPSLYTGGSSGSATSASSAASSSAAMTSSAVASSSAVATSSGVVSSYVASSYSAQVTGEAQVVATSASTSLGSSSVVQTSAAAAVETSAAVDVVTATATDIVTAQVYTTVTAGSSATAAVASAVSNLPSEVLTSTIATTLPTATASGSSDLPTKPLPKGTTVEDLLQWVEYLLGQYTEKDAASSKEQRKHARDMLTATN